MAADSRCGDVVRCVDAVISVQADDSADAALGCAGAADAVAFLVANGLDATQPAEIVFVDRLPASGGGSAFGCYLRAEQRIYMISYAECQWTSFRQGLAMDRVLYRSLVAHEVAHLFAAANFAVDRPTTVAHEYLASVTMLGTMPETARQRWLAAFPGDGFDSDRQIGLTFYLLSPHHFAAEAYRHFLKPGMGTAFLRRVLAGEALSTEEPP
jgi:hypothetical protein